MDDNEFDFGGWLGQGNEAPVQCLCGRGYCPAHGTYHFTDRTEQNEVERRLATQHGTRGGQRVIRKRIGRNE